MSLKKTDESSYGMLIFSHVPFYSSSTQTSAATLRCKQEKTQFQWFILLINCTDLHFTNAPSSFCSVWHCPLLVTTRHYNNPSCRSKSRRAISVSAAAVSLTVWFIRRASGYDSYIHSGIVHVFEQGGCKSITAAVSAGEVFVIIGRVSVFKQTFLVWYHRAWNQSSYWRESSGKHLNYKQFMFYR